jgi:hypothetical protein
MNTLSDSLTIGMILALVFGAVCFYLYSRVTQVEKRVGLTENILLDLKMATENTLMSMTHQSGGHGQDQDQDQEQYGRVEPISEPTPLDKNEVENINDEDFYKSVLQQAQSEAPLVSSTTTAPNASGMEVNYESMSLKELKSLVKERNVPTTKEMNKKDYILALKRHDNPSLLKNVTSSLVAEPLAGSEGSSAKSEEGFPVELGNE